MKVRMEAGSRVVEVETGKGDAYTLDVLRKTVEGMFSRLKEPRLESAGVGFMIERADPATGGGDERTVTAHPR